MGVHRLILAQATMSSTLVRRFRPAVTLALALALHACSTTLAADDPITSAVVNVEVDGLTFTATSTATGKQVDVTVLVRNLTTIATETTILGGNCRLMIRLYDASLGTDAWSEYAEVDACQEPAQTISLAPGEQETMTHSATVDAPSGNYLATVTFQPLNVLQVRHIELVSGNVAIN